VLYGDYVSPYTISTAHTLLEKGLTWEYRHIDILKFVTRVREPTNSTVMTIPKYANNSLQDSGTPQITPLRQSANLGRTQ
jgi:hypothetical protein